MALLGIEIHGHDLDELAAAWPALGCEISGAPVWWGTAEPRAGERNWEQADWWDALGERVGAIPELVWYVYPIHMNDRGPMPEDLQHVPLDDAALFARFEAFLGEAADRLRWNDNRSIVLLGNEVDIFADAKPEQLEAALALLERSSHAVRSIAPSARVCHAVTFDAIAKPTGTELIERLSASADLLGFTHYGLDGLSAIRTDSVEERFGIMENAARGTPLVLPEFGMPTAEVLGSSEQTQVAFVDELFDAVERRTSDALVGAIWPSLRDWPVEPLRIYAQEQFGELGHDESFIAFLTSFGLEHDDGSPKPGLRRWIERAAMR